ncbi:Hypp2063 [Branchiostoma lanceolatum]|uniref:Hypp2063 protein n=1 Tax=Branchiostoma lanceolatum TaxID=7740 RepID=A0A8J9ZQW2_BRALA|nr:Hypp2063 [Branchiostoma lanceolatum]
MSTLSVLSSNTRPAPVASRPSLGDSVRQLADSLVDLSWVDSSEIDKEVETLLGNPPEPHSTQSEGISSDDSGSDLFTDSESDSEDDILHSSQSSEDEEDPVASPSSLFADDEISSDSDGDCEDSPSSKVRVANKGPVAYSPCLGALMKQQARCSSPNLHSTNFEDVYNISWLFDEDDHHHKNGHTTFVQNDEDICNIRHDNPTIASPKSSVPRVDVGSISSRPGKINLQFADEISRLHALSLEEDNVKTGRQRFGRNKPWHQMKKLFTRCVTSSDD